MTYRSILAAGAAAIALAAHAAPPQFRVIETGVAAPVTAFNNQGEMVFRLVSGFDVYAQAAIWSAGTLTSPRTGYALPGGVSYAQFNGWGMNDQGVVVGTLSRSDWSYGKPFRWDSATGDLVIYEKLTGPSGAFVYFDTAEDINNSGSILGASAVGGAQPGQYGHARDGENVRWLQDGRWFAPATTVRAMNDAGDVVGQGLNTSLLNSGIAWLADGTRHFIDPLGTDPFGYRLADGVAINNEGMALFNSTTTVRDERMPFLWQDGVTTPLGFYAPGFTNTTATGLNNLGAVTGNSYDPVLKQSLSWLWEDGQFWNLQSLLAPEYQDWTITVDRSLINDLGQVATYACKPFVGCQALLLDPIGVIDPPPGGAVPEPATWAMLIAGFGLVGGALRRRPSTQRVAS
jgi:hypothetical protein